MSADKAKVAILSTWNEICGIAHFTGGIYRGLQKAGYDVEVLPTPRMILGNARDAAEKEAAENYCKHLAKRLEEFDHVNIQFEPGILASDMATAMARFKVITKNVKSMSITWHYIARRNSTSPTELARLIWQGKVRYAMALKRSETELNRNWNTLFNYISRKARAGCKVSHIVHTKRDAHLVNALFNAKLPIEEGIGGNIVYGNETHKMNETPAPRKEKRGVHKIYATPLTYLDAEEKAEFENKLAKSNLKYALPKRKSKDTRYIGVFGFFSGYKGFETAIDAIDSLPPNYELLMFSSVHESTLRIESKRDEYLGKLTDHVNARDRAIRKRNRDNNVLKSKLLAKNESEKAKVSSTAKAVMEKTFEKRGLLSDRVHFLGAVSDDDLILGMLLCDAVLFPYINSPHTASGPMAQAVELDRRIFASRNIQFVELAKFHENHFEFCDIGNAIEYAQKIPRMTADRKERTVHGYRVIDYPAREREYTLETAVKLYEQAIARR